MYINKKIIKLKKFFFFLKKISIIKNKKIKILGPYGNYSYNIFIKKINKNIKVFPIKKIKFFNNKNNIIPYENNNGGLVLDTIFLLKKKKIFIHNIFILNVNHNYYIYKKKKIIYLHNQSKKQIFNNLKIYFKLLKIKKTNSNSNINDGFLVANHSICKILLLNIINIKLKDNIINKTKFISDIKCKNKKKFISFITFYNKKIILKIKNINNIYINFSKNLFIECYFLSFRNLIFIMKYFKKKIKIIFTGFYSII